MFGGSEREDTMDEKREGRGIGRKRQNITSKTRRERERGRSIGRPAGQGSGVKPGHSHTVNVIL